MIMKGKYHNNGDIFGDIFRLLLPPSVRRLRIPNKPKNALLRSRR
jgi:hypothetical protein